MNSRSLSALFPSAAQAHAAAEVLERRGAVLLAMETEPRSTPQPLRRSRTSLDWTSLIVSAASVLLLALATICVPGVGYALALVALVTLTRVRPHEIDSIHCFTPAVPPVPKHDPQCPFPSQASRGPWPESASRNHQFVGPVTNAISTLWGGMRR
jgi:hypothetical protein